MNAAEAATVLTAAALVDKRTIGEADARMWADILPPNLGPRVAIEAVKAYYRDHREWVMPADVVKYAGTARDRLRGAASIDAEKFRSLPTSGDRQMYFREYFEAIAAGADHAEADRMADAARARATDAEKRALEPAPKPASYYTEW